MVLNGNTDPKIEQVKGKKALGVKWGSLRDRGSTPPKTAKYNKTSTTTHPASPEVAAQSNRMPVFYSYD
jgi:hypothetical protein